LFGKVVIAGFGFILGLVSLALIVLGAGYYFIKFNHASIYSYWNLIEFHQHIVHILVVTMFVGALIYFIGLIAGLMSVTSHVKKDW